MRLIACMVALFFCGWWIGLLSAIGLVLVLCLMVGLIVGVVSFG